MEYEELVKWMEGHSVGETLRAWASNDLLGHRAYGILEDLATKGKAVIAITINPNGSIGVRKEEVIEPETKQETQIIEEPKEETAEPTETPKVVPKKVRRKEF